jgi:hypothetical protein
MFNVPAKYAGVFVPYKCSLKSLNKAGVPCSQILDLVKKAYHRKKHSSLFCQSNINASSRQVRVSISGNYFEHSLKHKIKLGDLALPINILLG